MHRRQIARGYAETSFTWRCSLASAVLAAGLAGGCLHFDDTFLAQEDAGNADAAQSAVDAAAQPQLALALEPAEIRVRPDSATDVDISIVRADSASVGDVIVSLGGDVPAGISADSVVIAAAETLATLSLEVASEAALGLTNLTLDGRIAETGATGSVNARLLVAGEPGTVDPSFSEVGTFTNDLGDTVLDIEVAATERILVATSKDGVARIVALLESGEIDSTFGVDGVVDIEEFTFGDMVPRADGGALVVGTGAGEAVLRAYTASGQLDSSFQGGGVVSPEGGISRSGQGVAVAADGRIFIAGRHSNNFAAIYRFSASGLFEGFGEVPQGRSSEFISLGVAADGDVLALGPFSQGPASLVASFDPDSLEPDFAFGTEVGTAVMGAAARVSPKSMAVGANGTIAVTSSVVGEPEPLNVSALTSDGVSVFMDENRVSPAPLSDCAVDSLGRILAVSTGVNLGTGTPLADLYRFTADGNTDTDFAANGRMRLTATDNTVTIRLFSMGVQPDGRILVGGTRNSNWVLQRYWD